MTCPEPPREAPRAAVRTRLQWFSRTSPVGAPVVALIAVVVVTQAVAAFAKTSWNGGDVALIELRTRDVFSSDPPVVGAYSRYGWSHPGPLLFYVLAIPYRLLGGDATAMRLAALMLNTAVLGLLVWLLSRRGRLVLAVGAVAIVVLVVGLLPNALIDSWNVTIAVLPFALAVVACWCALCGDRHALLIAALASAFVLQAHVGFGVVLLPVLLATAAVLIVQARRARRSLDRRASMRLGGALALVFLPVIYDSTVHLPGNVGRLVKWSLVNDEPKVGITKALRVVARSSSWSFVRDPQLRAPFSFTIDRVPLGTAPGILLMALAACTVVAARRGWRPDALLGGVLLTTWIAAFVAVANVTLPMYFWLVDWLQPLAWLSWSAVAVVLCRSVAASPLPRTAALGLRAVVVAVAAAALAVAVVGFVDDSVSAARTSTHDDRALKVLTAAALTVDDGAQTELSWDGDALVAAGVMEGLFNQLDRAGRAVCVADELAHLFGDQRVCGGPTTQHLLVRTERSALAPPDGAIALALVDPLTTSERAEADSLTEQLTVILAADGRTDDVALLASPLVAVILERDPSPELVAALPAIERLAELRRRDGTRIGLYLSENVPR